MHLGELEGVSAAELSVAVPATPDARYPGGESAREFVERIMGTFYGLVAAHPGEAIVAVSHGGVISTALSIWSVGHGGAWREYVPANCGLSVIEFNAGPTIVALNDCVHL
jgi:broad specificity phosphatase PhoE